jgi:DNA polymerase-3 subunit alpha
LLREDCLVVIDVKVMQRMAEDGEAQGMRIIAESVHDLATVRKRFAKRLELHCNGNASADRLQEILGPHRDSKGAVGISLRYEAHGVEGRLDLPDGWRVNPDDALIERLREWLTPAAVKVLY